MNSQAAVVLITAPSREVGRQIASLLLEKRLAACVNILGPVNSLYTWEGKAQEDEEYLLVVKTRTGLLQDGVIPAVQAVHPYDLPEIIALPVIGGLEDYLDWIQNVTGEPGPAAGG